MIEAYAFLAAFAVQILVVSVLHAAWLTRYVRAKAEVQFPGWDGKSLDRFLSLYRVVNTGIAVLGLVLLGWLFSHMRSPDWNIVSVIFVLAGYSTAQMLPLVLISLIGAWIKKKVLLRSPPQAKRTASLQRRGLFDIVSPFTVLFAAVGYVLFAAFVIHLEQHPVAGNFGYMLLLDVSLAYALNAFLVYWLLYRRKRWPLETSAYRMRAVEVQVRIIFYVSIAVTVLLSLFATLRLLNLIRWAPLAISVYYVIIMLFTSAMLFTLRRQAEEDRLGSTVAS
jgi:hypothetical protein